MVIHGDTDIKIINPEKRIESISKDISSEPNEASLEIYNLNPDTRAAIKDAADRNAPIEIGISPLGSSDTVMAFKGEIETAMNRAARPGFVTRICAQSQKRAHRAAYVTQQTYTAGTPKSDIVGDLLKVINLPTSKKDLEAIPTTGILLAHSFSGPAFPILRRLVFDFGMYCYIDDGVLRITHVYEPLNTTIIEISEGMLVTEPQDTMRSDARKISRQTVSEMNGTASTAQQKGRKKAAVDRKEPGSNDYVEIKAIDTVVPGIELECFAIPNLAPDHLITLDDGKTHYRVFETELSGDDLRGGGRLTSRIRADRFEGEASQIGAIT